MAIPNTEVAEQLLNDPCWRLNHLYYIIDKSGNKELFKLNWAQEKLYNEIVVLQLDLEG